MPFGPRPNSGQSIFIQPNPSFIQNSHMMAVDGGSKLLIYGGYDGISTQDAIWMFSMSDKQWSILGTMSLPRDDHFVLPVNDYTC